MSPSSRSRLFSPTRLCWRLALWFLVGGLFITAAPAKVRAEFCLPPIFGERPRLHEVGSIRVVWLEVLLREHEVCWRRPTLPQEKRIFAYGNSSIFGFPHKASQSAIGMLNRHYERSGVPAHLYNLAFSFTYQLKEAMIINESLRFEPDVIVYGVSLDDLFHRAPVTFPELQRFFDENSRAIDRLAVASPPTLEKPVRIYREKQRETIRPWALWLGLRQAGVFVRRRVADAARSMRSIVFARPIAKRKYREPRRLSYDCAEVTPAFRRHFRNWQDWTLLEYLADLRDSHGIEVLVVNMPVVHEPRGDCYNFRYPADVFSEYTVWLEERTRALGLPLLDLHDLLESRDFIDSIHPTQRGQRKVAMRLGARLRKLIGERSVR